MSRVVASRYLSSALAAEALNLKPQQGPSKRDAAHAAEVMSLRRPGGAWEQDEPAVASALAAAKRRRREAETGEGGGGGAERRKAPVTDLETALKAGDISVISWLEQQELDCQAASGSAPTSLYTELLSAYLAEGELTK